MLSLTGIRKSFRLAGEQPIEVLRGVDFSVVSGRTAGVMGRSGSGKSTLLSIIGLLDSADEGKYMLDGAEIGRLSGTSAAHIRGERLGFVFQRSFLLPHLSAAENVEVPLLHARKVPSPRDRRRLVAEALDYVGIGHRSRHRPRELSGGEQQLVALARALVRRPGLILADEPTGNLDPVTGERIVRTLEALASDRSVAVVMVTHDRELAMLLDQRYLLADGTLRPMA